MAFPISNGMKRLTSVFFHWLPLGATIVVLAMFIYIAVQQNYRQGLNDPQIQMVIDAQKALQSGKQPAEVVGRASLFDVEKSLSPFLAVYDKDGNPLESSASLGNVPPKPPLGVFEYAKAHGENRVSWQPNSNTRIALVVRPINIESGWFVASGRNMAEVERRISDIGDKIFLGTLALLLMTFVLDFIGDAYRKWQMKNMGSGK